MRDFTLDLEVRMESLESEGAIPDLLAFAEGRLLSIHPFADFNGRVTRVWLSEILRRLQIAPVLLAPEPGRKTEDYLCALRAVDQKEYEPLKRIWLERLSQPI